MHKLTLQAVLDELWGSLEACSPTCNAGVSRGTPCQGWTRMSSGATDCFTCFASIPTELRLFTTLNYCRASVFDPHSSLALRATSSQASQTDASDPASPSSTRQDASVGVKEGAPDTASRLQPRDTHASRRRAQLQGQYARGEKVGQGFPLWCRRVSGFLG